MRFFLITALFVWAASAMSQVSASSTGSHRLTPMMATCGTEKAYERCLPMSKLIEPQIKKAIAGDYQSRRNIAFCLASGCEFSVMTDQTAACAWRRIILKTAGTKVDRTDIANEKHDCKGQSDTEVDRMMAPIIDLAMNTGAKPASNSVAELRKMIVVWLDETERTDRLWRKGSINGKSEQIRVLTSIRDLPENVPDGPLDAAKVNCAMAGRALANAMSSEQSLFSAASPDQAVRWQRSLGADKQEFKRYSNECRRLAVKAR